jgi:hypothetical protein
MKKKVEKVVAAVVLAAGYGYLLGLGILRAVGHKPSGGALRAVAKTKKPGQPEKPLAQESGLGEAALADENELQSLSLSVPGDAPLDRLARTGISERTGAGAAASAGVGRQASVEDVLNCQALESARIEGWSEPKPDRLPVPTYAPAIMAFGIVIFAMGLATVWYVCLVGSLVFAVAAWRWTGELQGE